ncbi:MAG: YjbF family lipoprotein [Aeromonadaceae bacterium]
MFPAMRYPLWILAANILAACSTPATDLYDTVKLSTLGTPDANLSADEIKQIPYATAYFKIEGLPRALVVLAFAENNELKWMSADRNLFVTRHGRLVKTLGLRDDLRNLTSSEPDPLHNETLRRAGGHATWRWQAQWSRYPAVHEMCSELTYVATQTVEVNGQPRQLVQVEERVTDVTLAKSYRNEYWLDPVQGDVIMSRQQLGVDLPVVEMTILNPYTP